MVLMGWGLRGLNKYILQPDVAHRLRNRETCIVLSIVGIGQ